MKIFFLIAIACCVSAFAYSSSLLEVKSGYFFFLDSKMNKVYDRKGLDLQVSGSTSLCEWLNLYGSVEWFQKSGRSLNAHQKTRISAVPLSLGLQAICTLGCDIDCYLTLGPRYFFVRVHNDSTYVQKHMHADGIGGFANAGILFRLCSGLTFDLFTEYSYAELKFHSCRHQSYGEKAQVGGLTVGAGLGYSF